jgi:hypothetical protein
MTATFAALVIVATTAACSSNSNSVSAPTPTLSTGTLQVRVAGTGSSASGYTAMVDGSVSQTVQNGTAAFTNLVSGSHSVGLSGFPSTCRVSGDNPRTVTVPAGGTVATDFDVVCSAALPGTGS